MHWAERGVCHVRLGRPRGLLHWLQDTSAAAETFWTLQSNSAHIWLSSARRHFLMFPDQEGCDLPHRGTSVHGLTLLSRMIIYLPCVDLPEPQCNNLLLCGFINDEMVHSIFLSGKCVKPARVPGKYHAFNYILVIKASFKNSWAIKQSESSVYHHKLLSRQSWCQRGLC